MTLATPRGSIVTFALLAISATTADAQMPLVDSGGASAETPAASAPVSTSDSGGGDSATSGEGEDDDGFFYVDGENRPAGRGLVPQFHVVETGDTLWEISDRYFSSAWDWPRVWSYNPTITSPHWIYPGDLIRLIPVGSLETASDLVKQRALSVDPKAPKRLRSTTVTLRQLSFVDREALREAARVKGGVQEKVMLTEGDTIYLSYNRKRPLKVGQRYSIYSEKQRLKHPKSSRHVGSYVNILGELEVLNVYDKKHARAMIHSATDVIERGARVGPLKKTFREVPPVPNRRDLQGRIVAMLHHDQLIGQSEVVFLDLRKRDGIQKGNQLFVVRRGDAWSEVMGPGQNTGQNDSRYPNRAIGELIVVQVGENQSIALVKNAIKEAGIGDIVVMRKSN